MCNLLGSFKGKLEVGAGRIPPCIDRLRTGHPVEGIVDLHTVELLRVVSEELLLRKAFRVETWPPFFVAKAGGPEPNRRHSGIIAHASAKRRINTGPNE